jgi:transcriptional regulator
MLIHSYDAGHSEMEWRDWISQSGKFGILVVASTPGEAPISVPTHFVLENDRIFIHLHKSNSVIAQLRSGSKVTLSVVGDYAYIPNQWRAKDGSKPQDGVPTSYYAAVNFECLPTVVDSAAGIVAILKQTMAEFQPEGGYAEIDEQLEPYGKLISVITGVELQILRVDAKFKYDDHKDVEFREQIIQKLIERDEFQDFGAAQQQRRRLQQNRQ